MTKKTLTIGKQKVVLIPNKSRSYGQIVTPEAYFNTAVCMVQNFGRGLHKAIKNGAIVLVSSKFTERAYQLLDKTTGMFICEGAHIFGVIIKNKVYPLGNKVVFERNVDEVQKGAIVIPAAQTSTDQSLNGTIYGFGLPGRNIHIKTKGLTIGKKVRLRSWGENMIEVGWQDRYFLFVNEEDIVCEL